VEVASTGESGTPGPSPSPSPTPTPHAGSGPVATAVALTHLSLSPVSFRPVSKKQKKNHGTTISYTDSVAARTTFTVEHAVKGKLCAAPPKHTRAGRKPKACTRYILLKGSFSHIDQAGRNTVRWTGALSGRPLSPGSYRLLARPVLGSVRGTTVRHTFTINH
jgi:hypothetical protein